MPKRIQMRREEQLPMIGMKAMIVAAIYFTMAASAAFGAGHAYKKQCGNSISWGERSLLAFGWPVFVPGSALSGGLIFSCDR